MIDQIDNQRKGDVNRALDSDGQSAKAVANALSVGISEHESTHSSIHPILEKRLCG